MARPPVNRFRKLLLEFQTSANEFLETEDETSNRFRYFLRILREMGVTIKNLNDNSCLEVSGSARYINRADPLLRELIAVLEAGCGTSSEAPVESSEDSVESSEDSVESSEAPVESSEEDNSSSSSE